MDNARYGSTIWNKGVASYIGNYGTRATEDVILTKLYSAKYGIDEGRWANPERSRCSKRAAAYDRPCQAARR